MFFFFLVADVLIASRFGEKLNALNVHVNVIKNETMSLDLESRLSH